MPLHQKLKKAECIFFRFRSEEGTPRYQNVIFWPFLAIFGNFWAILGHFGSVFGPFWVILGDFGPFWAFWGHWGHIFATLGHLGSLTKINRSNVFFLQGFHGDFFAGRPLTFLAGHRLRKTHQIVWRPQEFGLGNQAEPSCLSKRVGFNK